MDFSGLTYVWDYVAEIGVIWKDLFIGDCIFFNWSIVKGGGCVLTCRGGLYLSVIIYKMI